MSGSEYYSRRPQVLILYVVLLFSFSSCKFLREKFHHGDAGTTTVTVTPKADSTHVSVTARHASDSVSKAIKQKKAFEKALTDSLMGLSQEGGTEAKGSRHYYIIAGSFGSQGNAREAAVNYQKKGYKAEVLRSEENGGKVQYLVWVKDFSEYDKASVYLKDIRAKSLPGAWIYEGK